MPRTRGEARAIARSIARSGARNGTRARARRGTRVRAICARVCTLAAGQRYSVLGSLRPESLTVARSKCGLESVRLHERSLQRFVLSIAVIEVWSPVEAPN